MKTCRRCNNRPFFGDDEGICTAKGAPISDPVTGAKYCREINTDGKCAFYVPSRRHLLVAAFVALGIAFVLALVGWWAMSGDARTVKKEAKSTEKVMKAIELEAQAMEKAKLPAKVYDVELLPDGNYRVKEYHPFR